MKIITKERKPESSEEVMKDRRETFIMALESFLDKWKLDLRNYTKLESDKHTTIIEISVKKK